AEVLGRARIDPAGPPPFKFQITFDDAAVRPGRRYVVRATIRHQGRLLFTTDRTYPVLRGGADALLDVLLVSAGGGRHPAGAAVPAIDPEGGALSHQRPPSRNAGCGRRDARKIRGGGVALKLDA